MQGELFRAHAHIRPRRANFFAHKARQHGDTETTNTTAHPQQGNSETDNTTAPKNCTKNAHFSPAKATTVSDNRAPGRQGQTAVPVGGGRAWLRCPWAAVGLGRATSGQPTLQTSSNQRDSNHLARTPVTNVVNLSPKTTISSEKALGLTTFVTTGQKSTRKTPWIDDVCNNTRRATRQHTRLHWCGGRRRDRRARAGNTRTTSAD